MAIAKRQRYLKPLQQLQVLLEELGREPLVISEDEGHRGLLQDAIVDKVLSLRYSDDLGQHVCQPDGVNEIQVVQTSQVVVVMKQHTVVMEKGSSCSHGHQI